MCLSGVMNIMRVLVTIVALFATFVQVNCADLGNSTTERAWVPSEAGIGLILETWQHLTNETSFDDRLAHFRRGVAKVCLQNADVIYASTACNVSKPLSPAWWFCNISPFPNSLEAWHSLVLEKGIVCDPSKGFPLGMLCDFGCEQCPSRELIHPLKGAVWYRLYKVVSKIEDIPDARARRRREINLSNDAFVRNFKLRFETHKALLTYAFGVSTMFWRLQLFTQYDTFISFGIALFGSVLLRDAWAAVVASICLAGLMAGRPGNTSSNSFASIGSFIIVLCIAAEIGGRADISVGCFVIGVLLTFGAALSTANSRTQFDAAFSSYVVATAFLLHKTVCEDVLSGSDGGIFRTLTSFFVESAIPMGQLMRVFWLQKLEDAGSIARALCATDLIDEDYLLVLYAGLYAMAFVSFFLFRSFLGIIAVRRLYSADPAKAMFWGFIATWCGFPTMWRVLTLYGSNRRTVVPWYGFFIISLKCVEIVYAPDLAIVSFFVWMSLSVSSQADMRMVTLSTECTVLQTPAYACRSALSWIMVDSLHAAKNACAEVVVKKSDGSTSRGSGIIVKNVGSSLTFNSVAHILDECTSADVNLPGRYGSRGESPLIVNSLVHYGQGDCPASMHLAGPIADDCCTPLEVVYSDQMQDLIGTFVLHPHGTVCFSGLPRAVNGSVAGLAFNAIAGDSGSPVIGFRRDGSIALVGHVRAGRSSVDALNEISLYTRHKEFARAGLGFIRAAAEQTGAGGGRLTITEEAEKPCSTRAVQSISNALSEILKAETVDAIKEQIHVINAESPLTARSVSTITNAAKSKTVKDFNVIRGMLDFRDPKVTSQLRVECSPSLAAPNDDA